jgi:hypothetical protein
VPSVFEDSAVLCEAADRNASQHYGLSVIGAVENPSGGDAVVLGDLLVGAHPQVLEDAHVEGDRFAASVVAVEGHVIDVIHEVGAVELLDAGEVTRADDLDCLSCPCRVVVLAGGHAPSIHDKNVVV